MNKKQHQAQFDDLQKRMHVCRLCREAGFYIEPPAIAKGALGAKIVTIGQAPGVTEVVAKRPFNAGSGTRLFKWLSEAGIDEEWFRRTQYMTAVTKCFPGKNKTGGGDRAPSPTEQALCRPYLDEELELVRPELIIPIGRLAIEVFYPRGVSLEEVVGTEIQKDDRWIVPLPHPSGASRWHQIAENKPLINKAIRKIKKRYEELYPNLAS